MSWMGTGGHVVPPLERVSSHSSCFYKVLSQRFNAARWFCNWRPNTVPLTPANGTGQQAAQRAQDSSYIHSIRRKITHTLDRPPKLDCSAQQEESLSPQQRVSLERSRRGAVRKRAISYAHYCNRILLCCGVTELQKSVQVWISTWCRNRRSRTSALLEISREKTRYVSTS